MPGLSCIVKKELSDAASNRVFLLSCFILLVSCALTGIYAANAYSMLDSRFLEIQAHRNMELVIIWELLPQIKLVGALVSVAYGFNAVNKERNEGNLKVLLSYPIYRDQVILGKLLASLIIIVFVTFLSLGLSLTLYLFLTNIVLSLEEYVSYFAFTCFSALLLVGYLGVSIFLSIAFKDPKMSLIAAFLLISVFNSWIFLSYGRLVTDTLYGKELTTWLTSPNLPVRFIRDLIENLSPAHGLKNLAYQLFSNELGFYVGSGSETSLVWIEPSIWNIITNRLDAITVLIIIPVISFSASYMLFTRRDVT